MNAPETVDKLPPLTYVALRDVLDSQQDEPGESVDLIPDGLLSIHDHPHSGRPREIHVMVEGVKIAEIGPPDGAEGVDSQVAPGYIDLLAEWMGRPVHHLDWQNRILADNGLQPVIREDAYELAKAVRGGVYAWQRLQTPSAPVMELALRLANTVLNAPDVHPDYETAAGSGRLRYPGIASPAE